MMEAGGSAVGFAYGLAELAVRFEEVREPAAGSGMGEPGSG